MRLFSALLLSLTALSGPAHAREPLGFPLRVGFFGGWHATSGDFDVLGRREPGLVPEPGATFGSRLGWRLARTVALELEVGAVASPVPADSAGTWLLPMHLDLQWRPLEDEAPIFPVVGVGAGVMAQVGGAPGSDADLLLAATLGAEIPLGALLALRVTAGIHGTDGVDATLSWSPVASLGLDFKAWRTRAATVPERPARRLPTVEKPPPPGCPLGVPVERCTDVDGDQRIDAFDRCPTEPAGTPDGCPDPDRDGVRGLDDACPRDRGPSEAFGCPR